MFPINVREVALRYIGEQKYPKLVRPRNRDPHMTEPTLLHTRCCLTTGTNLTPYVPTMSRRSSTRAAEHKCTMGLGHATMMNIRQSLQTSRVTIRRAFAEHGDEACIGGFNVHKVTIEHGVMLRVLFDSSLRHEQPQYFDQSFRACVTSVRLDSPDRATRHTERNTATSRATHKDPVIHTRDTLEMQYLRCRRMKKKCAQHKCRPQGVGQGLRAFVADLIFLDVQLLERRVGLMRIPRRVHHGVARIQHMSTVA